MSAPATACAPPLEPGDRLVPGYVVEEHLSRNKVLDVYEVWSAERDCPCVVKVLRPDCRRHARRVARLELEGRLLLELAHPHLVRAYEVVRDPELAVVLETLGGERLDRVITHGARRLPAVEIAQLGVQLCSVVGYLHRQGWLHLDLKPTNVIVDCGIVRLFDLSLVRRPGPGKGRYGTAGWLSPEQERGDAFGAPTDAFGIAGVLFAAATRRAPCPWQQAGEGGGATAPPRVRGLRRLPGPLAEAIDAGLAADPTARPSVRDIGAACAAVAAPAGEVQDAGAVRAECRPELPCSGPHPC